MMRRCTFRLMSASSLIDPIHKRAEKSIANSETELVAEISHNQKEGTDMCTTLTNNWVAYQGRLMPYRVAKLGEEVQFIREGRMSLGMFTSKDLVMLMRFMVRLVFSFMVGVMVGRQAIYPLLHPSSPFNAEVEHNNRQ